MEIALVLAIALLLVREALTHRERRDMLDRLMARSLPEFKDHQTTQPNELDDTPDETVDLAEAEDDLNDYGQEN